MLALVNVQHSGTGFVVRHLFAGKRVRGWNPHCKPREDYDLVYTHATPEATPLLMKSLREVGGMLTTIRTATEESWRKRGLSLADLSEHQSCMDALMREFDFEVLHLDDEGLRDDDLDRINRRFGLALVTDWRRIPSMSDMQAITGET